MFLCCLYIMFYVIVRAVQQNPFVHSSTIYLCNNIFSTLLECGGGGELRCLKNAQIKIPDKKNISTDLGQCETVQSSSCSPRVFSISSGFHPLPKNILVAVRTGYI